MKSFSNTKDNRGNCAMEQGDMMKAKALESKKAMAKLLIVCGLSFIFMIAEFVGGWISGSLAIMTDAAHMLSDVAGFLISYFAIFMGSKPANFSMSFGYHRAEILGAMASILLIWGLLIFLLAEAIHRFITPEPVDGEIMLITACVGLVFNIIAIFTLHNFGGSHHGHSHGDDHTHAHEEEGKRLSHCHLPQFEKIKAVIEKEGKVKPKGEEVVLKYDDEE